MPINPNTQILAKNSTDVMIGGYVSATDPATNSVNSVLPGKRWTQLDGSGNIIGEFVRNFANTAWLPLPILTGVKTADSSTIDFSGAGTTADKLTGEVIVSGEAGNAIEKRPTGLFAAPGTGQIGPAGAPGTPGTVLRSGSGAPSNALGINGDYYLNTTNGDIYQKASGVYAVSGNLKGPTGQQGIQGQQGAAGQQGATGQQGIQGIQGIQGPAGASSATVKNLGSDFGNSLSSLLTYAANNAGRIDCEIDAVSTNSGTINFTNYKHVRFVFKGAGALSHSGGRLTIPKMADPGNRKIFTLGSGGEIVFAQGAVSRYTLAWYADAQNTDCTEAIDSLIASLGNNSGGEIQIPNGVWWTRGGHILSVGMRFAGEGNIFQSSQFGTVLKLITDNAVMMNLTAGNLCNYGFRDMQISLEGRYNSGAIQVTGASGQGIYQFNAENCSFTGTGTVITTIAAANAGDTIIYVTNVTKAIPQNATLNFGNGTYATVTVPVSPGASSISVQPLNAAVPGYQSTVYQGEVTVRLSSDINPGAAGMSVYALTGMIPQYTELFFLGVSVVTTSQVNQGDTFIPIAAAQLGVKTNNCAHYGGNSAFKLKKNGSDMEMIQSTFRDCQFYSLQTAIGNDSRNFNVKSETCHFSIPPGGTGFNLRTAGGVRIVNYLAVSGYVDKANTNTSLVRMIGAFNQLTLEDGDDENIRYLLRNSIYPFMKGSVHITKNTVQSNIHTQANWRIRSTNNTYVTDTSKSDGYPYTDCVTPSGVWLTSSGDEFDNRDPARPDAEVLLKSTTRYSYLFGERGYTNRAGTNSTSEYCVTQCGYTWVQPGLDNVIVYHTGAAIGGQVFTAKVVSTDAAITQKVVRVVPNVNAYFVVILDGVAPAGKPVRILWEWESPKGAVSSDYSNVSVN